MILEKVKWLRPGRAESDKSALTIIFLHSISLSFNSFSSSAPFL